MPPVSSIWNIDWLNANSQRSYPISETASRQDVTGSFTIPNDLLVDLILPIQVDVTIDPTLFHVKSIGVFGGAVVISFGYNGTLFSTVAIDVLTFQPNTPYRFVGSGLFFDSVGTVVIGKLDQLLQTGGSFEFSVGGARLEPHVLTPSLRGVQALYLQNGDDVSDPITGDVIFQAGRNAQLTYVEGAPGEPDRIQINAIDGAGLNTDCTCGEATAKPCIKTINGIGPDNQGDFKLLDDQCLKLIGIANGLQLEETCANPCCGCDELSVVQTTLQQLTDKLYTLESEAYKMEVAVQQMEMVILSSKTGLQT